MERKRREAKTLFSCMLTALVTAALVFGAFWVYFGGNNGVQLVKKLNAVRTVIDEKYVGEADWESLTDELARAMVAAVDDRWSYYMNEEEMADYRNYSRNATNGIGVSVQADEEGRGFLVVSVTEDSPAQRAGIRSGHIIVALADQEVSGMNVSVLRRLVQDQKGSYEVTILDESGARVRVTLKNEEIFTNPVSYGMKDQRVGYIRIANFEEGAAKETIAAMEALEKEGAASLVFDVRSNPGGRLDELVELLDHILPAGDVFISVSEDGEEEIYSSDEASYDCPMVVLINANSYSAAEFFAAALKEYEWATVIGEASTGKSRSQQTFTLYDGSAVHISTRSYLTPGRVNLAEQGGLQPDITVAADGEKDAQLEKALEYLS